MTNMLRIPGTLPPGFTAYADAPPTQTPEEIAVGQSTLLANWFDLSIEESCTLTLATISFAPVESTRKI